MTQIGYADFIRVLNVHDPLDWVPGLEVRMDGIWVVPPRAIFGEHNTQFNAINFREKPGLNLKSGDFAISENQK